MARSPNLAMYRFQDRRLRQDEPLGRHQANRLRVYVCACVWRLARVAKMLQVPVNPATMKADVRATARAMSANTIMVYASAPSFPHGVIDPVEDLAKLASSYGVSCSSAWLLARGVLSTWCSCWCGWFCCRATRCFWQMPESITGQISQSWPGRGKQAQRPARNGR